LLSAATTTAQGIVELATTAEATAGTDTTRAVTPAGLAVAPISTAQQGALDAKPDTAGEIADLLKGVEIAYVYDSAGVGTGWPTVPTAIDTDADITKHFIGSDDGDPPAAPTAGQFYWDMDLA
jgi:hypothetical protein